MTDHPLDRRELLRTGGVTIAGATALAAVTAAQSEQDPIEIADWHDLDVIRYRPEREYALVADLDPDTSGYDEHVGDPAGGWDPIGGESGQFVGRSFDGDGHEVAGLRIDRPDEDYIGLFGHTSDLSITSLDMLDADIVGQESVGAVVGRQNYANMTDVRATGNLSGAADVGGIVGDAGEGGTVKQSHSSVSVSGGSNTGGLVGNTFWSRVYDSVATGTVTGTTNVGGLVGHNNQDSHVEGSYATGDVSGDEFVGGLVGYHYQYNSEVRGSYATGSVSGTESVGGLVGGTGAANIIESYATSSVSGTSRVGGLVGALIFESRVVDSYALGSVDGETYVGGLVGYDSSGPTVTESYAAGSVDGDSSVGGLVGRGDEGRTIVVTVTDSYWDVPATGQTESNGGTGLGNLDDQPPADEMTGADAEANMDGFDFEETWMTVEDPDDYPRLGGQLFVTATVNPDRVEVGETATIEIGAGGLTTLLVDKLWTDWVISGIDPAGGDIATDTAPGDTPEEGKIELEWQTAPERISPSVTVDLPARYTGGEFLLDIRATTPDQEFAETTATVLID